MKTYGKEYEDWISQLKVSDEVAVHRIHLNHTTYRIVTIEKITKTGLIKVSGNEAKYRNGIEMGNSGTWTVSEYLEPVTEEVRESIERSDKDGGN